MWHCFVRAGQTRSTSMARPWPTPTHKVASPRCAFSRSILPSSVTVSRAPLQPSGCPRAMAPPSALTVSMSSPSRLTQASTCGANASLISTASRSSADQPARASAFSLDGTGPRPIRCGGPPAPPLAAVPAPGHRGGGPPGAATGDDPRPWLQVVATYGVLTRHNNGGSSVGERRRRARGHDAAVAEDGAQLAEPVERRVRARALVSTDGAVLGLDRQDLGVEPAVLCRSCRPLVRTQCERVGLLTRRAVESCDLFGGLAHGDRRLASV